MAMLPMSIVVLWLFGLLSFGVIGGGVALVRAWYQRAWAYDPQLDRYLFDPHIGVNVATALLLAGLALLVWSLAGGALVSSIASFLGRSRSARERPNHRREGSVHRVERPDGTILQVECYGPADGPAIVLTHGLGATSTEWWYLKRQLADRFRLIVWDIPGLGRSTRPADHNYQMEKLAGDLEAVLRFAHGKPAVLVGHSIGAMTILTFCRLFPAALGTQVAGFILAHATYTNPMRTTRWPRLSTALERPLVVPLLHLTIWLTPLVQLMNWLSYLNGTAHLSMRLGGFASTATWEQIAFLTSFQPRAAPDVLARAMLAMLRYDETATLPTITIPGLVIAGDRDMSTRPEASEYIDASLPVSRLETLAPAKHMGLIEHNKQFAQLVAEFTSTVTPAVARALPADPPVAPLAFGNERH